MALLADGGRAPRHAHRQSHSLPCLLNRACGARYTRVAAGTAEHGLGARGVEACDGPWQGGGGGGRRQGVLQRDHAGGLAGQAPCQRLVQRRDGQRVTRGAHVHDAPAQAAPSWQHVGGDEARTSPVRVGRVARDPSAPPRSILGLGRAASAQRSSAAACKTCSEVPEEAQAAARRAGPARVGLWVHTGLARLLCALTSSRARCNRPLRCRGPGGKRTSCAALKHPVQRRSRGAAERVGCLACRPKRSSVPGV